MNRCAESIWMSASECTATEKDKDRKMLNGFGSKLVLGSIFNIKQDKIIIWMCTFLVLLM